MKAAIILLALAASHLSAAPSADPAPMIDPTAMTLAHCLGDAGHGSTGDQTDCEAAAKRTYDRRMNAAYATLMRKLPAGVAQRLRSSQHAWLAFGTVRQLRELTSMKRGKARCSFRCKPQQIPV